MLRTIIALVLLSIPSVSYAETIIIDDIIQDLPADKLLWEVEATDEPYTAHEIYKDVAVLPNGYIAFAGQIGDLTDEHDENAFVQTYTLSGQERWYKKKVMEGFQSAYDIAVYDNYLLVLSEASDHEGEKRGKPKDRLEFKVYNLNSAELLHSEFISDKQGSFYAPRMTVVNNRAYLKAFMRDNYMREYTVFGEYKLSLEKGLLFTDLRWISSYEGRTYDLTHDNEFVYLVGGDGNTFVKLYKHAGFEQNKQVHHLFNVEHGRDSHFSSAVKHGQTLWMIGDMHEKYKRSALLSKVSVPEGYKNVHVLNVKESSFIASKSITSVSDDVFAATVLIEPKDMQKSRYSALLFFNKAGKLCSAYRLGKEGLDNIIANKAVVESGYMFVAGAKAPYAWNEMLDTSRIQKKLMNSYNAYGMAIKLDGLDKCNAETE